MFNGRLIVLGFLMIALVGTRFTLAQSNQGTQANDWQRQSQLQGQLQGQTQGQSQNSSQGFTPAVNQALVDSVAIPVPTEPFQLTKEESDYLDQVLGWWQSSSEKVKTLECKFKRFDYDTESVNYRDPKANRLAAASIAIGDIRFAAPDCGFYETGKVWVFAAPPAELGGDAKYEVAKDDSDGEVKEKWLCDGKYIYEYDFKNKILYDVEIPADMRGAGIVNSPIPFLFGATKSDILNRYWIRPVRTNNQNEYWLEAYPKRVEDARMYSKVEIILDGADCLPKAIHTYSPQYNPQKGNYQSRYFQLEDRQMNRGLAQFQNFMKIFVRPQTPPLAGWRRVERSALHDEQQATLPHEKR